MDARGIPKEDAKDTTLPRSGTTLKDNQKKEGVRQFLQELELDPSQN